MTLGFYLSMPSNNSWNGKWSGDDRLYARVMPFKMKRQLLDDIIAKGRHYYNFGDGWCACVEVKVIDAKEARRIRTKSQGFCGYDWMIDSILAHGGIYTEPPKQPALVSACKE